MMLPAPGFHHLHLNSFDPEAAIAFYTRQFPSTARGSWGGFPALFIANDVMVLFDKVDGPAPTSRRARSGISAGMSPTRDAASKLTRTRPEVELLPLYTSEEGGSVLISSDTWPGQGGVLGLTKAQIAEAKQKGRAGGRWRLRLYEGVPMTRSSNMPATTPRSGSTMCISTRKIRSARSSGTRST